MHQSLLTPSKDALVYIEQLLEKLLHIPSPSGNTERIIRFLEHEINAMGHSCRRTNKGALLVQIPGIDQTRQKALTAHVDTLGAMVRDITSDGRLKLSMIGGYAWATIEGEYCTVETLNGQTFSGTVILHNTSIHVNKDVIDAQRTDQSMEIVLDAAVRHRQDVVELGIQIGDFVSFDPRVQFTETGFIKSRHLDDKASTAILLGLLKTFSDHSVSLPHSVQLLISNNEEIGYGGNSNLHPSVTEYVAVDMGAIGDSQATDEYCVSICAKDSSGPYHLGLRRHLVELARQLGLHYKVDIYPFYNSDVSAALKAGHDVVHGLVGPGIANSHAYERTHRDALWNTFQLLMAYVQTPLQTY